MLNEYERQQLAEIEAGLRADSPELFEQADDRGPRPPAGRRITRWWTVLVVALLGAGQLWSSPLLLAVGILGLSAITIGWIARDVRQILAQLPPTPGQR